MQGQNPSNDNYIIEFALVIGLVIIIILGFATYFGSHDDLDPIISTKTNKPK